MHVRSFGIITCLAGLVGTSHANADCRNTESARTAYKRGEQALQQQNVELAVRSFTEANRQCPNPQTQLAIANAYLLGRQGALATDALNRYILEAAGAIDWCSVLDVRRQIAQLNGASEQKVTVRSSLKAIELYVRESTGNPPVTSAPGCRVQTTSEPPFEVTLPPGNYVMTGLLAGKKPSVKAFELSKPSTVDIFAEPGESDLGTTPANHPPLSTSIAISNGAFAVTAEPSQKWYKRPETWVWLGSGVVAVGGAVAGIWALSMQSDLNRECPDQKCPQGSSWGQVDKHDRLATLSTVGFVLAGVGAATGAGIYLIRRRPSGHPETPQVTASVSLGQLMVTGSF
jgi:hypothetical protein